MNENKNIKVESVDTKYPKADVIFVYSFLGGGIGGILLLCFIGIFSIFENGLSFAGLTEFVKAILPFGLLGMLFGLLPALLTAMYITSQKFYISSYKSYISLFLIGSLTTLLCYFVFLVPMMILFPCVCVGGLSAMIVGHLVVPKNIEE